MRVVFRLASRHIKIEFVISFANQIRAANMLAAITLESHAVTMQANDKDVYAIVRRDVLYFFVKSAVADDATNGEFTTESQSNLPNCFLPNVGFTKFSLM